MLVAVGLLFGVQYGVDELTRKDWNPVGPTVAMPTGEGVFRSGAQVGIQGGVQSGPSGSTPGNAGSGGAVPPSRGAALPSGLNDLDPALRQKAQRLQRKYSDRLSRMSTSEKMRLYERAKGMLGK